MGIVGSQKGDLDIAMDLYIPRPHQSVVCIAFSVVFLKDGDKTVSKGHGRLRQCPGS